MKDEVWADIKDYEGLYQVSNFGQVKSLMRAKKSKLKNQNNVLVKERILKQYQNKKGYMQVELNKNGIGKTKQVHRLVAEAFIPNPNNLPQINHKDEKPNNNIVINLEWCSAKYNNNYGTRIERMTKKVKQYTQDNQFIKLWNNEAEIIKVLKIFHVGDCCKGKRITAGGYKWKYYTIDGIQMK